MNINEILLLLLQAVIIATVPVITMAVKGGITGVIEAMKERTDNDKMKVYLDQIGDAVKTAVSCTSQTYVDSLKKDGAFNREEQKAALAKSLEAARASLSPWVKNFIISTYGDLDAYLIQRIEAEVRSQKKADGAE